MRRIGKYELLDLLGRGGCGEVWKARDAELGRVVALKLMQRTDAEDLARFKREAHVVAQLSHPNIAQLYEFSVEPPYLAMQYIEGGPISEAKEKIAALRDAARAVHFAHERGILHRDLKPANIMVDSTGRASVLDFGLAREVKSEQTAMTMSGDILGTPSYMAPEQARGDVKNLDARTDVYGLGATLYFLLTGRPPHTGATAFDVISKVLNEDPAPSGADRDLSIVAMKAMEKDPARRYGAAAEFAEDLDRYLRQEPIRARPASTFYRLKKRIQRQPALWGLGALLGTAVMAGLASFTAGQMKEKRLLRDREAALTRALEQERWTAREERRRGIVEGAMAAVLEAQEELPDPSIPLEEIQGKLRGSIAKLEAGVKAYDDQRMKYWLGRANDLLWRDAEALRWYTAAIESDAGDGRAYFHRARVRLVQYHKTFYFEGPDVDREQKRLLGLMRGDLEKARGVLTSRAEREVVDGYAMLGTAEGREKLKELCRNRTAQGGRTEEFHFLLGCEAQTGKGDWAESVRHLDAALERHPRHVQALALRGTAKGFMKDYAGEAEDCAKAIALKPDFAEAHHNLGVARFMLGEYEAAAGDFTRVIELWPKFGRAYSERGGARAALGDYRGQIEDCTKAIELEPGLARAYDGRGTAKGTLGDFRGEIEDCTKAIELDPGMAAAYLNRSAAKGNLGDFRGAIEDCTKAIELKPDFATAYDNRAAAKGALGDHRGAVEDGTRAIKLDPGQAMPYVNRGASRGNLGDFTGEIEDQTRAIELDPMCYQAFSNRGVARVQLGDYRGACEDLRKTLELAPPGWPLRDRIAELLEQVRTKLGEGAEY